MNVFNKILETKEKSFHKEQKEKNEDEPKVCPACNQEPCTCVSECESCGA